MNCPYCGTEIPFDESFCRNCGRAVVPSASTVGRNAPTVPFSTPPNTVPFNPYGDTAENSSPPFGQIPSEPVVVQRGNRLLVPITIASIIVALGSVAVLGYFFLTRPKVDQTTSTSKDKLQPTASPSATNSSATPTPTVQPTASPAPTVTPKPTPNTAPPPGARLGYCNDTNVLVRNGPDLNARPVTKVTRGQNLWVIGSSSNYSTWKGITSNWTQVQLYNSTIRGWVFTPFVSYATENE